MNKRFSFKVSIVIVFSFIIIAIGVILLFQTYFVNQQTFAGDKRIEEIYEQNFTLAEDQIKEISLQYITEEDAIEVASASGIDEGFGWIVSFHYINNPEYKYVWAVTGSSTVDKDGGEQVIINAKTGDIVSKMDIDF